jgi:hypothetical protein
MRNLWPRLNFSADERAEKREDTIDITALCRNPCIPFGPDYLVGVAEFRVVWSVNEAVDLGGRDACRALRTRPPNHQAK